MTDTDINERYLAAVAAQLPADQRDDIIEELRDLILSRIEAREDGLGRVLTDAEKEDTLREIGHPLVVAARYRRGPDSLIGPELFPYWLFGMKAGLIVLAVAFALSLAVKILAGPAEFGQAIAQAFQGFFGAALTLTGVLTLFGAVMENQNIRPRWLTHWRVADLGAFNIADPTAWAGLMGQTNSDASRRPVTSAKRQTRSWPGVDHLFSLLFSILFVLWWLGVVQVPGLGVIEMRGEDATINSAPVWTTLFIPILLYGIGQASADFIGLIMPERRRLVWLLEIGINAVGLWLAWMIWQAGHWFTLVRGGDTARIESPGYLPSWQALEQLRDAGDRGLEVWAQNLSMIMTWALLIGALALVGEILSRIWRLARH